MIQEKTDDMAFYIHPQQKQLMLIVIYKKGENIMFQIVLKFIRAIIYISFESTDVPKTSVDSKLI